MFLATHRPVPIELDSNQSDSEIDQDEPQQPQSGPSRISFPDIITPTLVTETKGRSNTPAKNTKSTPGTPSRPPSRTERRFVCEYEGCDKAYFKPSRLAEHQLSHTGERPHACPHCSQTYFRASHLHAHLRIHLTEDDKTYTCEREGCGKRFWTGTHLRRHHALHDEPKLHKCDKCDEAFAKAHLLRDHVTLIHTPSGTKPYPCTHEGCGASFAMKAHLKAHEKTHDPNRYTCSDPSHTNDLPSFPTWTALQTHIHTAHPILCPHPECTGRTFKTAHRLKEHLKVHEDREVDLSKGRGKPRGKSKKRKYEIEDSGISEEDEFQPDEESEEESDAEENENYSEDENEDDMPARKRQKKITARRASTATAASGTDSVASKRLPKLIDGEAGKVFACGYPGCGKKFKTKYALTTHARASHLQLKPYKCTYSECDKAYAHQASLNKHLSTHAETEAHEILKTSVAKLTTSKNNSVNLEKAKKAMEQLTGVMAGRRFPCPIHIAEGIVDQHSSNAIGDEDNQHSMDIIQKVKQTRRREGNTNISMFSNDFDKSSEPNWIYHCPMRFWRVYDVRRHLISEHGIELDDGEVRRLLALAKKNERQE